MYIVINRLFFFTLFLFFVGCAPKYSQYISQYKTTANNIVPNYSNFNYWAAHPWKKDPSDTVFKPLRKEYFLDSSADVFFIYPTSLTNNEDTSWNANINDANLNAKTDYTSLLFQASVFNHYRIFSPRYRQAHVRAYFTNDTARAKAAFDLAYEDIKTAFQYYLDHYNNGRPIIIASHSQGSTHAQRLLKDFFENTALEKQLVVAYVLGMYIPNNYFASLKICSDSSQTGCVCGWRTFKKEYEPDFVTKENGTCLIVNPLTWTTSTDYASNNLDEGAIIPGFAGVKKHFVSAQIHNGILWVGRLHLFAGIFIRRKNFHSGDINLFYLNIRNDVQRRVNEFKTQTR